MSVLWIRRVSWMVVLGGVVYAGSLAGTVRSQDTELDSVKPAPTEIPAPLAVAADSEERGNAALQAVGGLGVGHIQSTLGLIGVTADAFARDIYDAKKVEELMNGTINGIEAVKKLLRNLADTNLSDDDEEFINRMVGVFPPTQQPQIRSMISESLRAVVSETVEQPEEVEGELRHLLKAVSSV